MSLCVITVVLRNNRQIPHSNAKTTSLKMTILGTILPRTGATANYKGPHTTTRLTSKNIMVIHRDRVWVRKDHSDPRGLAAPLCYVATGYQGPRAPDGEHHHAYLCYDKKDIMWARRVRFHLGRFQP